MGCQFGAPRHHFPNSIVASLNSPRVMLTVARNRRHGRIQMCTSLHLETTGATTEGRRELARFLGDVECRQIHYWAAAHVRSLLQAHARLMRTTETKNALRWPVSTTACTPGHRASTCSATCTPRASCSGFLHSDERLQNAHRTAHLLPLTLQQ